MLANTVTYPQPTFVTKPADLLDGDVVIDARNRQCAVRRQPNGKLSLVKPRSGATHDYTLPKGGKLVVVGRVEGGWSPISASKPTKSAAKVTKQTAAPRKPRKSHAEPKAAPAKQSDAATAISAVADMLDAASAALRTVATLV